MIHQEFDFNYHNTNFYGQYWQSTSTKAVAILVHGMGEHSSRYTNFVIPKFLEHQISVVTYDQFGHGKSGGKRGHAPSFEALLDCVETISFKATNIFGDVPTFLYGHSMGGNLVINYILRRKNSYSGVIATSPFLQLAFDPPSWKLFMGKIIQKVMPSVTMPSELEVEAISRDSAEVEKYIGDPLIHDKISPNYSITIMKTGAWAIANAQKLNTPLLIIHGTNDRITSYRASEKFIHNSNDNGSLKLFEGGYHELHNDLCKEEMMHTLINWIELQLKTKT